MLKLFYTLLVIEYVVDNEDVATSVIFEREHRLLLVYSPT